MQLSTRGRYAVMALAELAARERDRTGRPVTLAEIAASQQLSLCYLEQLFGRLRRAGLVASARGPGGGYRLSRPAGQLVIAEILLAVDEPLHATRCAPASGGCMRRADGGGLKCRTHDLWHELGRQIHLFLAGVTLADVVEGRVLGRAARLGATPSIAAE
ncbi:MAG: Rrf2 family transcriptional regulator [Acidisphaera sp.]|nr:Rrf2 family transcriptional regulator [Acidisphaera sp.]